MQSGNFHDDARNIRAQRQPPYAEAKQYLACQLDPENLVEIDIPSDAASNGRQLRERYRVPECATSLLIAWPW